MKNKFLRSFVIALVVGAVILAVPLGASASSHVSIPISRPLTGNAGFLFLSNADGSKWFAFTIVPVVNNTELGGVSSYASATQSESYSALDALSSGIFMQLELNATNNKTEALTMAYVNTNNLDTFHSGELINQERSDVIYLYQYVSYDGIRVRQKYSVDPAQTLTIDLSNLDLTLNPAISATTNLIYGEVGGNLSLKLVRHRASDNKYLGGPYTTNFAYGGLTWTWNNENVSAIISGTVDTHLVSNTAEHNAVAQVGETLSESASALSAISESLDSVQRPQIAIAPDANAVSLDVSDNSLLLAVRNLFDNELLTHLLVLSLTLTLAFVLLRGARE